MKADDADSIDGGAQNKDKINKLESEKQKILNAKQEDAIKNWKKT